MYFALQPDVILESFTFYKWSPIRSWLFLNVLRATRACIFSFLISSIPQVKMQKQTWRHSVTAQACRGRKNEIPFQKKPKILLKISEDWKRLDSFQLFGCWPILILQLSLSVWGCNGSWSVGMELFPRCLEQSSVFFSCSNTLKFAFLWPDNLCECVMRTLRVTHTFHLRLFVGFLHGFVNLTCARSQLYWICGGCAKTDTKPPIFLDWNHAFWPWKGFVLLVCYVYLDIL